MKEQQDAFGHALLDQLGGVESNAIIERSDGLVDVSAIHGYFSSFEEWGELGRKAADAARGRVLDVGCGAGRFALHLEERGHEVVAIDNSPAAIEVCRQRGVRDARLLSIARISQRLGRFDTILMMGNNFGLFGNASGVTTLLRRFHRITNPDGQLIAQILDPYQTDDPVHLDYQEANRRRGRLSGQIRLRVRYRTYRTPWFDHLFVSLEELKELVHGTGWKVSMVLGWEGPIYVAVLGKTAGAP